MSYLQEALNGLAIVVCAALALSIGFVFCVLTYDSLRSTTRNEWRELIGSAAMLGGIALALWSIHRVWTLAGL